MIAEIVDADNQPVAPGRYGTKLLVTAPFSCFLSDAYPDIKAALDAERAAETDIPVSADICEIAEAQEAAAT